MSKECKKARNVVGLVTITLIVLIIVMESLK